MSPFFYIMPFASAFVLTVGIIFWGTTFFSQKKRPSVRNGARHRLSSGVSRFGGIAMALAFFLSISLNKALIFDKAWFAWLIALGILLLVGWWDDREELSWKMQLGVQFLASGLVFLFGIRIVSLTNPFGTTLFLTQSALALAVSFALTVLWIIAVMNALNWADGIDGLCGGLAFIGSSTLFALALRPEVSQPPVALAAITLAGASLGFMLFNFYPAKILAGTSGSWFFGFTLAVLAIFSGAKIATALLVLSLPLVDAGFVIFERFRSGVSVFSPDQRHLHYRLLAKGFSPLLITLFLLSITLTFAFIALHSTALQKILAFGIALLGVSTLIWYARK